MVHSVKFLAVIAIVASFFFLTSTAFSDTIPWTDNVTHWAGWGGYDDQNNHDTIGEPDFTGGTVVIDNGVLTKVTINYAPDPGWGISKMLPGDLFLDTNSDGTWDYVVSLYNGRANNNYGNTNDSKYIPSISSYHSAPVYTISLASDHQSATGPSYLVTDASPLSDSYWPSSQYIIRYNQPFAVTDLPSGSKLPGTADVSFSPNVSPLVFDLSKVNIPINGPLTIGFTTNCANDVVYASTVPEPGTPLMLGSGLILTACVLRLKKS